MPNQVRFAFDPAERVGHKSFVPENGGHSSELRPVDQAWRSWSIQKKGADEYQWGSFDCCCHPTWLKMLFRNIWRRWAKVEQLNVTTRSRHLLKGNWPLPFLAKLGGQHLEASQPCKRNPVSQISIICRWDFYLALTQYKCNRRQNTYIQVESKYHIYLISGLWLGAGQHTIFSWGNAPCGLRCLDKLRLRIRRLKLESIGDNFVTAVIKAHLNSSGVDSFVVEELLDSLGHCHVLRQVQTTHLQISRIYWTHLKKGNIEYCLSNSGVLPRWAKTYVLLSQLTCAEAMIRSPASCQMWNSWTAKMPSTWCITLGVYVNNFDMN